MFSLGGGLKFGEIMAIDESSTIEKETLWETLLSQSKERNDLLLNTWRISPPQEEILELKDRDSYEDGEKRIIAKEIFKDLAEPDLKDSPRTELLGYIKDSTPGEMDWEHIFIAMKISLIENPELKQQEREDIDVLFPCVAVHPTKFNS